MTENTNKIFNEMTNETFNKVMNLYTEVLNAWEEPIYKAKAKANATKEFEKIGLTWEEVDAWYFENCF